MRSAAFVITAALLLPLPAVAKDDPCGRFPHMLLYGFSQQRDVHFNDPRAEAWREDTDRYWKCRRALGKARPKPAALTSATTPGPCPSVADMQAISQGRSVRRRCPDGSVFEMEAVR